MNHMHYNPIREADNSIVLTVTLLTKGGLESIDSILHMAALIFWNTQILIHCVCITSDSILYKRDPLKLHHCVINKLL